jgi:hypothetical protein
VGQKVHILQAAAAAAGILFSNQQAILQVESKHTTDQERIIMNKVKVFILFTSIIFTFKVGVANATLVPCTQDINGASCASGNCGPVSGCCYNANGDNTVGTGSCAPDSIQTISSEMQRKRKQDFMVNMPATTTTTSKSKSGLQRSR